MNNRASHNCPTIVYSCLKEGCNEQRVFKKTREEATILGRASRLASVVYKSFEGKHKHYTLFRQLTGKAKAMISHGMNDEDIVYWLGQSL